MITPTRLRALRDLAVCVAAFMIVGAAHATRASAQGQGRDSSAARTTVTDLPLTATQRQAYVGRYQVTMPSGEKGMMRVIDSSGVLQAQPDAADKPLRMLYQGGTDFRPEGVPDFVFHFVLDGGRATKFTVRKEDGLMQGVRAP